MDIDNIKLRYGIVGTDEKLYKALDTAIQIAPTDLSVLIQGESGIIHELRKRCPGKTFIPAPPDEAGCACNECGYMKLNTLEKLRDCLRDETPEINIDPAIAEKARRPIERMLELS